MISSIRHSQLLLRFTLAIVFFWFGLDKFIQPQHWLGAWISPDLMLTLASWHVQANDVAFLAGIFEILVALGLATGFFMRYFAFAAGVFLVIGLGLHGLDAIQDVAMIGALGALALWPERTYF